MEIDIKENTTDAPSSDSDVLTWTRWGSGYEDFLRTTVRTWLEEQGTVSPDGNPWE